MLSIFFGPMPEAIYDTAVYFKNTYSERWITAPLAVEMIRDVDRFKVIGPQIIESPVLGMITPLQLSGSVHLYDDWRFHMCKKIIAKNN